MTKDSELITRRVQEGSLVDEKSSDAAIALELERLKCQIQLTKEELDEIVRLNQSHPQPSSRLVQAARKFRGELP